MAYVPVPKDLTKVKSKFAFNLTKRQILFFGLAAATGTTVAAFAMILVMLPCFLFAMYEKNGMPLEKVLRNVIQTKFIRPKERPYKTQNFYAVVERQTKLTKEVSAIVKGTDSKTQDANGKRTRTEP